MEPDGPRFRAGEAVVAQTPLEAWRIECRGAASLLRGGDELLLRLDLAELSPPDGYDEVWLLAEGEGGWCRSDRSPTGARCRCPTA